MSTADTPTDRTGFSEWTRRIPQIESRIAQLDLALDVVWLGDSITEQWIRVGANARNTFWPTYNVLNEGIASDRTEHILWRVAATGADHLNGLTPKCAVIMAGTNNVDDGVGDVDPEDIRDGVIAIASAVLAASPTTKIIIMGILPRETEASANQQKVNAINALLAVDPILSSSVVYIATKPSFVDGSNVRIPSLYADAVHLTAAGYDVWAGLIDTQLRAFVGSGSLGTGPGVFAYQERTFTVLSTDVVGTTIAVACNLGGAVPKLVKVKMGGVAAEGAAALPIRWSYGAAIGNTAGPSTSGGGTGPSERGCIANYIDHAVANTRAHRVISETAVGIELSNAGVIVGALTVDQLDDPDLVTLRVSTQFATTHNGVIRIYSGDALEEAVVALATKPTGTSDQDIVTGHRSRFVEFLMSGIADTVAIGTPTTTGLFGIGRSSPGVANQLASAASIHNVATSDTFSYCNDAESMATVTSATPPSRETVSQSNAAGFRRHPIENSEGSVRRYMWISMGGTFAVKLGSFLTRTDTNQFTIDTEIDANTIEVLSHGLAESTIDVGQSGAMISVGSAELGVTIRQSNVAMLAQDASAAENSMSFGPNGTGATAVCYTSLTAGGTIDGALRISSKAANVLTAEMVNPDPSQRFVLWAALGSAPSGGVAIRHSPLSTIHRLMLMEG